MNTNGRAAKSNRFSIGRIMSSALNVMLSGKSLVGWLLFFIELLYYYCVVTAIVNGLVT